MRNGFMSPRTILLCIFCSLIANKAIADETERKVIQITFPKNASNEIIKSNLDQMGIILDEYSTINIHDEENYINLTCFNCIVRSVDSNSHISGSINELTSK